MYLSSLGALIYNMVPEVVAWLVICSPYNLVFLVWIMFAQFDE